MKKSYENLVFEGGGTRGFAYCGAIEELDKLGILSKITRFAGTSIGALFASLLVLGYTSDEINNLPSIFDFSYFTTRCSPVSMYKLWNYYGVNNTQQLMRQLSQIIKQKFSENITLQELYDLTNKELVICTCCLNREIPVYLHHTKFPEVKLVDAITASMSVPMFFQANQYDFLGTLDYYTDGGIVDNYPIWIFNDSDILHNETQSILDKTTVNPRTLGVKLLYNDETNTSEVFAGRKEINSLFDYSNQIISSMMMQIEKSVISDKYIEHTISIQCGNIYFLDIHLTKQQILYLIDAGKQAVTNFFVKL